MPFSARARASIRRHNRVLASLPCALLTHDRRRVLSFYGSRFSWLRSSPSSSLDFLASVFSIAYVKRKRTKNAITKYGQALTAPRTLDLSKNERTETRRVGK